jgi:uncharacterized membrane protein
MTGDIRIGDAERERAAEVLGDHYAAGRLDHSEYSERLDAVWTARTRADLDVLFHDLPRLAPPPPPAPARRSGAPLPVVMILALLVGAFVITHLPIIAIAIAIVLLVKMGHHRRGAARRHWSRGGYPARW